MTHDRNPHDGSSQRALTPEERLHALVGDGLDGVAVTPEEKAAAKLTAHALGELSPEEAAEIERRLGAPEAQAACAKVADLQTMATALRQPAKSVIPSGEPVGSAALRTAVTAKLTSLGHDRPRKHSTPEPSAAKGIFTRGPLSALPLLLSAGGTAAAVLALIIAQEHKGEGLRDDRFGSNVAQVTTAATPDGAVAAADQPADKAEMNASVAAAAGPNVDAIAMAGEAKEESALPAGPAVATDGLAAVAEVMKELDESEMAEKLAESSPAAGPASDAIAGKRMEAKDATEFAMGPPGAGGGRPGPGAALGMNGLGPPGSDHSGGRGKMGASPPPEAMAQGKTAPQPAMGMMAGKAAGSANEARFRRRSLADGEAAPDQRWFRDQDAMQLDLSRAAPGTERYARFMENAFRDPKEQPLSTFSIDVDTASYALVRRFLHDRQLPPPDAVRLEEMLNYFRYDDAPPAGDDPFSVSLETASCPWRVGHRLVRVGLKGREIAATARPGTSLVFLVDVSGSMNEPNKLPLVKQSLSMLVDQLTENDKVAIVTYAGDAGLKLAPTSGDQKDRIRAAIDALSAGGSTNGSAGIELAYAQAAEAFVKGGSNRVVLATDGDLNVGVTDDAALVELIKQKASGGVFLTVLGYGQGNLQDEKMEKLADNGNGIYAYIDGAREARKVLVEQLTGSTVTIAKDVKIQVEFNPAQVASYRLLGYENRIMAAKDFKDDTKDAGEIGAGHGVTALYEIVPTANAVQSPVISEPLKYQPQDKVAKEPDARAAAGPVSSELLTLKLRYKEPTGVESALREFPLEDAGGSFENASTNLRFAAAVAEFGMLLRTSDHRGQASLAHVTATAAGALGADPGGLRAEFLDLVREAGALLPHGGKPIPN
jgi:Ca-activated chloride channel family protein